MARFEIEYNGQRFEIEAPDQQSALDALTQYGEQPEEVSAPESPYQEREGLFPQFASGMSEGAASFLSLPNTVELGLRSIGPAIGNAFGGDFAYPTESFLPDVGASFRNFAGNTGALSAPSEDPGGQIVRRIGQELGANAIPMMGPVAGANSVANALRIGATETALAGSSGLGAGVAQQLAPDNALAEMAGQAVGLGAGAAALGGLRKLVTPNPISDERLAVARALQREGVDLTAGQVTGSNNLRYAESELGGSTAEAFTDRQAGQFTKAALQRAGINAERATPDVIDDAFRSIGAEFDRLSSNTLVPVDQQLGQDIGQAWRSYTDVVPESSRAPIANNFIDDLRNLVRGEGALGREGGVQSPYLSGDAYKSYRSRINRYMRSTNDPELKLFLEDVTKALDDSAERYLGQANPEELGAWRDVRRQYRNLLVIEKAATGAGEGTAAGFLSPQRLRQAVVGNDRRGYARGYNDFASLVRDGNQMMTPLPNSGTAGRMSARNLFAIPSTAAGALLGGATGDAMMGAVGAVAGAALPSQVGKALLGPNGRRYLTNQALRPLGMGGQYANNAVLRALAAQGDYDQ